MYFMRINLAWPPITLGMCWENKKSPLSSIMLRRRAVGDKIKAGKLVSAAATVVMGVTNVDIPPDYSAQYRQSEQVRIERQVKQATNTSRKEYWTSQGK